MIISVQYMPRHLSNPNLTKWEKYESIKTIEARDGCFTMIHENGAKCVWFMNIVKRIEVEVIK